MTGWRTPHFCTAVVLLFAAITPPVSAEILSSKRGFADTGATYNKLQATGAGWYYTWGTGSASPDNFDANHYPMFWNAPSQNTITNVKNRNPTYVLGFNEPERSDQANMSVASAISSWTAISNAFTGTNTKLVSPAVADTGGATGGQAWLASFMQQATAANLKVDAVAFHWYGVSTPSNPAGAASSFLSRVDSYHNSYGLPVFITEFAIHDWGNAYTDAEIIEANRQFLNIVIPGLESRPYVAGYAWFHWFGDAPLYTPPNANSNLIPTPMAYSYIGAVTTGQSTDIGGDNLGEHVAYLAGGQLTMTGSAGTIRYINALSGTSTITGGLDWGLAAGGSPFVRIQPGSSLRKAGANQITFGSGSLTNNGLLEVSQGTLRIGVNATGTGNVRVKGGTLALFGSGRLTTAPLIDVKAVGSLDVTAIGNAFNVTSGQTLNCDRNGMVSGNVTATNGSTIAGGGTFAGNLSALLGSTVRVGGDGAGVASRFVIDNFESYALGDVRTTASPPWTAHQDTTLADIESFNNSKVLTYGWASGVRGVSRSLPESAVIDNDETATLFFRINSKTDDPDHNIGLGDQASTGTGDFADFEAQLRMKQGTSAGTFALDARNGGSFSATLASGLTLNSWYNIWMVVNQSTDTYDLYMNTGTGAATAGNKLNATPLAFRNGTTNPLNSLLGLSNSAPIDNGARVDDLYYFSGADLTNPVAGFNPGFVWTAESLAVTGNYTQNAGATLQLNLLDPAHHDALNVTGNAQIGGTLNISFAVGAPGPLAGDSFDILDFGSLTGIFDAVVLPTLTPGLVWDNSQLLSDGLLQIVAGLSGDFNEDGQVDAADYVAWRDSYGQIGAGLSADGNGDLRVNDADYMVWRANFGETLSGSGASIATSGAIPEPTSAALVALFLGAAILSRTRRRNS
jgi:putative glycosyl hydrolase